MYGDKYWYWEKDSIPSRFKRFVCLCEVGTLVPSWDDRLNLPICGRCKKLYLTSIKECEKCNNLFLKDFHAPNFDNLHPLCWDCIEPSMSPPQGYPWGLVDLLLEKGIVPPQLMKKVDISDFSFEFE